MNGVVAVVDDADVMSKLVVVTPNYFDDYHCHSSCYCNWLKRSRHRHQWKEVMQWRDDDDDSNGDDDAIYGVEFVMLTGDVSGAYEVEVVVVPMPNADDVD